MEVFTHTLGGLEKLEDFNGRLHTFCMSAPVHDVTPSVAGNTLMLSLTEPEDLGSDNPVCILPQVAYIAKENIGDLERIVSKIIEHLRELDSEDTPSTPFRAFMHGTADGGVFVVIVVFCGMVDDSLEELPLHEAVPDPEPGPN